MTSPADNSSGGDGALSFRPLTADDLPQLHEWLGRPHVARWWGPQPALDEVRQKYLRTINGEEPTDVYLIVLDGREVGLIQTYRIADWPDFWPEPETHEPGAAGMDLFIAEEGLLGRGLGPRVIHTFVAAVVFADPAVLACWADPDAGNRRSVRAFEKAGFRAIRDVWAEDAQTTERLVRLGRDELESGAGQCSGSVSASPESKSS